MNPIVENSLTQIRSICAAHQVDEAHLFGSQATSTFQPESDIDILVKFSEAIKLLGYADNYFTLKEELEALLNKEIDLVSQRSLKNPVLIQEIERTKVALL